jgi:hypothetical protein
MSLDELESLLKQATRVFGEALDLSACCCLRRPPGCMRRPP